MGRQNYIREIECHQCPILKTVQDKDLSSIFILFNWELKQCKYREKGGGQCHIRGITLVFLSMVLPKESLLQKVPDLTNGSCSIHLHVGQQINKLEIIKL